MPNIDFGKEVNDIKEDAINMAKSATPDFGGASEALFSAMDIANTWDDSLKTNIFRGRITNDLGVVYVRRGLYRREHEGLPTDDVLEHMHNGILNIALAYDGLLRILTNNLAELEIRGWIPGMHSHIGATMTTWHRAVQSSDLVAGNIGLDKRADRMAISKQWMLGRGTPEQPGAWTYVRQGDNGYFASQNPFIGMRAERINGGPVHVLKALKWGVVRGIPEVSRRLVTDPENRKQIILTTGRLTLESTTRKRAIEAALDYRRF